ncbi:DUF2380 domain-containing protein [Methylobacter sp.]|uniref:DUF2380 domain-containing protein n=1 Tax=Methylobacter sp. TaxID=2051955 RepID=UPI002FDE662F
MKTYCFLLLIALSVTQVNAETSIAILDFELNDLTLMPRTTTEINRTASLKPLLEKELKSAGYKIISIDLAIQHGANSGFGYLFDHDDIAAELGRSANADYVLVGRLHKPSFLFAYIMGHLIRVKDGQLIGNYISETKGGDEKLTLKGIESIAVKVDKDLDNHYIPPPPKHTPLH